MKLAEAAKETGKIRKPYWATSDYAEQSKETGEWAQYRLLPIVGGPSGSYVVNRLGGWWAEPPGYLADKDWEPFLKWGKN